MKFLDFKLIYIIKAIPLTIAFFKTLVFTLLLLDPQTSNKTESKNKNYLSQHNKKEDRDYLSK